MVSLSILVAPSVSLAEESTGSDLRITDLSKGQTAPFTGILLTKDSLSKIENKWKLELDLLKNDHKFDISSMQLKLDAEQSLRKSEKEMNDKIFQSNLERIRDLENIALNKSPDWVLPVAILGSFLVGAGITVSITYAVNQ